ncbi:hypothetical protein B0H13DRAFT_2356437 [Mycena leptocephala]|nr:hypothetical protein B0H13DRAFT_2356437 [Mycena leptocephala]
MARPSSSSPAPAPAPAPSPYPHPSLHLELHLLRHLHPHRRPRANSRIRTTPPTPRPRLDQRAREHEDISPRRTGASRASTSIDIAMRMCMREVASSARALYLGARESGCALLPLHLLPHPTSPSAYPLRLRLELRRDVREKPDCGVCIPLGTASAS